MRLVHATNESDGELYTAHTEGLDKAIDRRRKIKPDTWHEQELAC